MSTNPPVPANNKAVYIGNLGRTGYQTPAPAAQAPPAINATPWTAPPSAAQAPTYSPQAEPGPGPTPSPVSPTNLPTYTNNPVNYAWSPSGNTPPPRAGQFLLAAPGTFRPADDFAINYSKLTGLSYASPAGQSSGGFCQANAANTSQIDSVCNGLDATVCASTQCCVLLGDSADGPAGSRCVAGGANGPAMTSYYTDPTIMHRDRYYYQGKCYGNCNNNTVGSSLPPVPQPAAVPAAANQASAVHAPAGASGAVPMPTPTSSGINYTVLADAAIVAGALLL